ncbi:hypothetical protein MPF19_04490 [Polaribacter sp. Z014]|uniref:HNH endonuclease n=1 Tax=Polaribacter sp. Z014 TaxID=2927126 RepID=UPI0020223B6D|nr:hypothetical protein [Polaribacter sp. Z014]MCL7762663.1 hypothetical protein [Polaribacter sp. Z014]
MIYLDPNKKNIKEACDEHLKNLFSKVKRKANNSTNIIIRNFLTDVNLQSILIGLPKELEKINIKFYNSIPKHTFIGYINYKNNCALKSNGKTLTTSQKTNIKKYGLLIKSLDLELNRIFNYTNSFSKKDTKYSTYDLANKLNINTCVYCNRTYTKTVIKPNKITRPEFDHWFPKSKFPLLALSFYNLIPSCHICNSAVKGTEEFNLRDHLHPYVDKIIDFQFSYDHKDYNNFTFKILSTPESKEEKTTEAFKLKEIYETHEDEIEDLRKIRDVYSDRYLQNLTTQFKGLTISEDEVYRLAFGVHKDETLFERRPLSKMKKDILIELGIIKKS